MWGFRISVSGLGFLGFRVAWTTIPIVQGSGPLPGA